MRPDGAASGRAESAVRRASRASHQAGQHLGCLRQDGTTSGQSGSDNQVRLGVPARQTVLGRSASSSLRRVHLAAVGDESSATACLPVSAFAGPWRSARRSSDGQTILVMITKMYDHGSDLQLWVELRGFEPLTPSMRTRGRPRHGRTCDSRKYPFNP